MIQSATAARRHRPEQGRGNLAMRRLLGQGIMNPQCLDPANGSRLDRKEGARK
jgi:hypothetical protein